MPAPKNNDHKIEPGMNIHIDRIRAIYPDDSEVFKIDGRIVIKPKGTTLKEAQNG